MVSEFDRRRQRIVGALDDMQGLPYVRPRGGFYVFPSVGDLGVSGNTFAEFLLDNYFVAVVPGSAFGPSGEGFIRIAYSVPLQELEEASRRLGGACDELRNRRGR